MPAKAADRKVFLSMKKLTLTILILIGVKIVIKVALWFLRECEIEEMMKIITSDEFVRETLISTSHH